MKNTQPLEKNTIFSHFEYIFMMFYAGQHGSHAITLCIVGNKNLRIIHPLDKAYKY